jgi:hypothetical protein
VWVSAWLILWRLVWLFLSFVMFQQVLSMAGYNRTKTPWHCKGRSRRDALCEQKHIVSQFQHLKKKALANKAPQDKLCRKSTAQRWSKTIFLRIWFSWKKLLEPFTGCKNRIALEIGHVMCCNDLWERDILESGAGFGLNLTDAVNTQMPGWRRPFYVVKKVQEEHSFLVWKTKNHV